MVRSWQRCDPVCFYLWNSHGRVTFEKLIVCFPTRATTDNHPKKTEIKKDVVFINWYNLPMFFSPLLCVGHQFKAHKAVLAACSHFFYKFFQDYTEEPLVEIEGIWVCVLYRLANFLPEYLPAVFGLCLMQKPQRNCLKYFLKFPDAFFACRHIREALFVYWPVNTVSYIIHCCTCAN